MRPFQAQTGNKTNQFVHLLALIKQTLIRFATLGNQPMDRIGLPLSLSFHRRTCYGDLSIERAAFLLRKCQEEKFQTQKHLYANRMESKHPKQPRLTIEIMIKLTDFTWTAFNLPSLLLCFPSRAFSLPLRIITHLMAPCLSGFPC